MAKPPKLILQSGKIKDMTVQNTPMKNATIDVKRAS